MKKIVSCLFLTLSLLVLFGCNEALPDDSGSATISFDEISDEDFLSLVDGYENHIYQSLYEIGGETYGRLISSSDSIEDAVNVCTRHFTDNRYPQAVNTVTECNVIYESDLLYGIHVEWELTNYGQFDGRYEENVISFKKDVADVTVLNVVYGDVKSYRVFSDRHEQVERIVLYLFYNEYFSQRVLDYEIRSDGDGYTATVYAYDVCYGDWGISDEYNLLTYTVTVDAGTGEVRFQKPTVLKTVYR